MKIKGWELENMNSCFGILIDSYSYNINKFWNLKSVTTLGKFNSKTRTFQILEINLELEKILTIEIPQINSKILMVSNSHSSSQEYFLPTLRRR